MSTRFRPAVSVLLMLGLLLIQERISPIRAALQEGDRIELAGRPGTLTKLDSLPFLTTEFSRRFHFDTWENPKLKLLRERYSLEAVVGQGSDEFEQQVLLMDWVHRQFKKFGRPTTHAQGALDILQGIEEGHAFFCTQYAQLLVSCAASLGWVDRPLALRRHQGAAKVGGSTEHSVTEIWSNQHRKWVMLDPTSNLFLEKDGIPLNAYEIRQEWFYQGGTNLDFVIGREKKRYRKSQLPVVLQTFPDFGELAIHPDELDKYGFIGYIPNTDLMDAGFNYAQMFITKDQLCQGTAWHLRPAPADPARDPYFPIGQAALSLSAKGGHIRVQLQTLTPNFMAFQIRLEGGEWRTVQTGWEWPVHGGLNTLEARTLNRYGVKGPISTAEILVPE